MTHDRDQDNDNTISEISIFEILTRVSIYANELRKRMIQAKPLEIFEIRDRILRD